MTLRVFEVSGIQVRLHYSWFIIFALVTWSLAVGYLPDLYPERSPMFYWIVGCIAVASLFLSVLIHEFSHLLVARRRGMEVRRITLYFFGGVAEIEEEAPTPSAEIKMAAAGPISSLVLALILTAGWRLTVAWSLPVGIRAVLRYALYINFMLAAFNMLPAFPMDGGRILRAFLWMRSGSLLSSTRTATRVSQVFSYLLMALGLVDIMFRSTFSGLWLFVIGLFLKRGADTSMNAIIISEALEGVKVGDIMTGEVHTVDPELPLQQLVDSYFIRYKHRGFPVVSEDRLVGLVTDHDVRQVGRERWGKITVGDIMKPAEELIIITPGDTASDALLKMSKGDVGRLPVMEGKRLVGIITRSDITRAIRMRLQFKS
ncbi:MAG: site-2 protease family protein [Candidatus Bathyarchaeia archaeon]